MSPQRTLRAPASVPGARRGLLAGAVPRGVYSARARSVAATLRSRPAAGRGVWRWLASSRP